MERDSNLGADEPQLNDAKENNAIASNTVIENNQNTIEISEEQLETEKMSLENKDDGSRLSINVADSTDQIIVDTGLLIEECSSSSHHDENQNSETNFAVGEIELSLPGAYHVVPSMSTLQRDANVVINAASQNITGDTIDNAFVVDDNAVTISEEDKPKNHLILFITVTAVVSVTIIVTLLLSYVPESTEKTINKKPTLNGRIHNDTQAGIDDFKAVIIQYNISSIDDLMNSSSAQSKALSWMTDEEISMLLLKHMMVESLIQRYVSVVFYYSLNGGNWSNRYSFLTEGLSECMWGDSSVHFTHNDGITCHNNGSISRIILKQNNLSGMIPREVGQLNSLNYLYLMDNDISGTIPSTMEKLDLLKQLSLSFNRLTGTIPILLANITNLKLLGLANPNLSGFEDFCPLLKGRNVRLETCCNESQPLQKENCREYTRHRCCQILEEDVMQCCPSNPTMSQETCYNPVSGFLIRL